MIMWVVFIFVLVVDVASTFHVARFVGERKWAITSTRGSYVNNAAAANFKPEKCILVAVDRTTTSQYSSTFSTQESLLELSELCNTAGLEVVGTCVQRLPVPNPRSFFGEGKLNELRFMCASMGAGVVVVDEDISPRQQRSLENALKKCGVGGNYVTTAGYIASEERVDENEVENICKDAEELTSEDNNAGSTSELLEDDVVSHMELLLGAEVGEQHPADDFIEPAVPQHSPKAKRAKAAYQQNQPDIDSQSVPVKVLDRTAVILDIFAQHAKSKEGQLQVELAMLQYRSTRGPNVATSANGNSDNTVGDGKGSSGAGLRGPGETKLELDKRKIKTRIKLLQDEIARLEQQRQTQRRGRGRLGAPLVALVGYTNAGKSTLLNKLSNAGVLAEDMLFATLDTTTRKIRLPTNQDSPLAAEGELHNEAVEVHRSGDAAVTIDGDVDRRGRQGMEIILTDTVGFISKLPSHIVAAFRATLESVADADILIHVCDRSNPAWQKQRAVVMQELDRIALRTGHRAPIVEFWNKVDRLSPAELQEALDDIRNRPIEMELLAPQAIGDHTGNAASVMTEPPQDGPPPNLATEAIMHEDDELYSVAYLPDDVNKADDVRYKIPAQVAAAPAPVVDRNVAAGNTRKKRRQKQPLFVPEETVDQIIDTHLSRTTSYDSNTDSEMTSSARADTELSTASVDLDVLRVHPSVVKLYTAAGSAVTGQGLSDLVARLEDALTAGYRTFECFIPYAQDEGVVSEIMTKGVVQRVSYCNAGTSLRCKMPSYLAEKLKNFLL